MGSSSSDTSEFGRKRNEIEREIDHLKKLTHQSKDVMNFQNPSKMEAGMAALEKTQTVGTSIAKKLESLKEHLETLKEDPDYATKESQFNKT